MEISCKAIWPKAQRWLKVAGLAMAGFAAAYIGALQPLARSKQFYEQRATGLGSTFQSGDHVLSFTTKAVPTASGVIGGVPGGSADRAEVAELGPPPPPPSPAADSGRKMIRTDSLSLVVKRPGEAAEQIRQLAIRLGGFLVTSEVSGEADAASSLLTIRVPAARFDEARSAIRKLGLRVESERVEAQDATLQYVDQQARLRNLRAEEQQYLAILKQAATVKDTLEVSEKLGDVRGEIEQQQTEFDALSKQVETVAITVSLQAEAEAQVFGLHWQPLYRLKAAARDGLDGLGDYLGTMTSIAFYLPAILLWLGTILVTAAIGWRVLRWSARMVFRSRKAVSAPGV